MRWFYLFLSVLFAAFAVFVAFYSMPQERLQNLRACILASAVTGGLFVIMTWAKKRGERKNGRVSR